MARKGDIDSKSVASRVPMEVYLRLLKTASSQKKTLSGYLCDKLSEENFGQGGETKIEYKEKIVYRDRIIEKPINTLVEYKDKIVYKDRIVEKIVEKIIEVDNPKLLLKIKELEQANYELTMYVCLPSERNKNKKP